MKNIFITALFVLVLNACSQQQVSTVPPAYYSDWDRAVRVDVDMQNMFVATPRKIQKPIDLYMAFALTLKYNYSRRLVTYEQAIIKASKSPVNKLPEIISQAGYVNIDEYSDVNSDLKVAWNILDISSVYYQSQDVQFKSSLAFEQGRKVIHNLMQETRSLYWKTLTAQKLLPTIDEMIEYLTLEVDELNAKGKELAHQGAALSTEDLLKKRKYMEAVKELSSQKREFETAEVRLASLMGFHPNTEYKLVGKEYGNFDLPQIKNQLSQLEWVALTNRPELRMRDLVTNIEDVKIYVKEFKDPSMKKYQQDPNYYNRMWSKKAKEVGMDIFENVKKPQEAELESLRRQRMTTLVLSQVYVSWARYVSAIEDYQISFEIATTSEDIAEDVTLKSGAKAEKSTLASARAIEDEVKAMKAYINLQDSLGNLYATLGLDAIPYYMLDEQLSKIAVHIRNVMAKWKNGEFLPDNRPYLLDVPVKRPPVNLSSPSLLPDIEVETGQRIDVKIPQSIFDKMDIKGKKIVTKAGLKDDRPLPKWLRYDEKDYVLSGIAMPSNVGIYHIKIYIADDKGNVGYINFNIKVKDVYVPSMTLQGLTEGRQTEVLKRCVGSKCVDDYVEESVLGEEVDIGPRY